MTVYESKEDFVKNELTALLCKIDKNIEKAEYVAYSNGEEFVNIIEKNGRTSFSICVTADSLSALARDVLRNIQ